MAERADPRVADVVANLIDRQNEILGGYAMARDYAPAPEHRDWLRELHDAHERSLRRLRRYARQHGRVPRQHATLRGWYARAQIFVSRFRSEHALDRALARQERSLCRAYERAVQRPDVPPDLRNLLLGDLMVEHEHHRVLRERLEH